MKQLMHISINIIYSIIYYIYYDSTLKSKKYTQQIFTKERTS